MGGTFTHERHHSRERQRGERSPAEFRSAILPRLPAAAVIMTQKVEKYIGSFLCDGITLDANVFLYTTEMIKTKGQEEQSSDPHSRHMYMENHIFPFI